MSHTIRIDSEVYEWLKRQAVPFDDTPNSVLRRVAGLNSDKQKSSTASSQTPRTSKEPGSGRRPPMARGEELIKKWQIHVRQARFHRDGHYYEHLDQFPAAFCDPRGYVIFETEADYRNCPNLHLGAQVNVERPGIKEIPGYHEVDEPLD